MFDNLIYYMSEDTIDQLYRKKYGPLKETSVIKEKQLSGDISTKIGLSKLISLISLSADAKIERNNKSSEQVKLNESIEDRANALFDTVFARSAIKDVEYLVVGHVLCPAYKIGALERGFGQALVRHNTG